MSNLRSNKCEQAYETERPSAMVEDFEELQASTPIMDVPIEYVQDYHLDELIPREVYLESSDKDLLSEEETQELIIEDKSQEVYDSLSIELIPIIQDHVYEETIGLLEDEEFYATTDVNSSILSYTPPTDPYWPSPLPPTRTSLFHAYQAHPPKQSFVGTTRKHFPYHAKLEGIHNIDPYVVLYDTHYGRMSYFDESRSELG